MKDQQNKIQEIINEVNFPKKRVRDLEQLESDRSLAEEKLREKEERLRLLSDNLPNGLVYQVDFDESSSARSFTYISAGVEWLHGITQEEAKKDPMTLYGQVLEEDRPLLSALETKALTAMSTFRAEVRIRKPSGEIRWIMLTSSPRRISKNHLVWDGIEIDITDLKRTEDALKESERKYRSIFDNANDAIFLMNGETFIDCNTKALEMFRCTREQIIGQPPYMFSPPSQPDGRDSAEKALEMINEALQGEAQIFEWKHCHYDRTPFDAEVSLNRIDLNNESYLQSIVCDITDRKRAEEALHESEQKFRAIFYNAIEGIFQSTPEGRYISVNPAHARMHGFETPRDMVNSITDIGMQLFVNPEDRLRYRKLLENEGFVVNFETELYRKDRTKIWVSANARAVRDQDGKLLYFEGTVINITERKQTEKALKESEEKYRSIFENSIMGIFRTTPDGHYLSANPAGVKMWGYESQEEMIESIIDMSQQIYVHPEDRKQFKDLMESNGFVEGFEAEFYTKDGSKIWASMNARAIRDTTGNILYYETTAENITRRKEAEKEREKLIDELQKALTEIKTLSGMLPICAWCKKIRDDKGYWNQIETYIRDHSQAEFSHSICPECLEKFQREKIDLKK